MLLLVIGIVAVYDVSLFRAYTLFGDKYYFLKNQLVWAVVGLSAVFVLSKLDYHFLAHLAPLALVLSCALLIAVLIPGVGTKIYGARRWLTIGSFLTVQPSEILKISLVIYLAAWLGDELKRPLVFRSYFITFCLLMLSVIGLVMFEPDFGTTFIIVVSSFIVYFVSGAPIVQFGYLIPFAVAGGLALIKISPYRLNRLKAFLDPSIDPQGVSYHINQILLALGSGGIFGLGLGQSRQKFEYLPEVNTDSIFAVIGEETGFVGAIVLISLFVFLIYRGIRVALRAPDKFGQLLAIGIVGTIAIQFLVNLGSMVALFPLTGVTLPFISYGGSSLVIVLAMIGVLLNVSQNRRRDG